MLLAVKDLRLDSPQIGNMILNYIDELRPDYKFELEGSMLMNFEYGERGNRFGVHGFITNYSLIVVPDVTNYEEIISFHVRSFSMRDSGIIDIINNKSASNKSVKGCCINNICYNYADPYNYSLTFASLLPKMTKSARSSPSV
jgi:hypothetical protein